MSTPRRILAADGQSVLAFAYILMNSAAYTYSGRDNTGQPAPRPTLQARKQALVRNAIWDAAIDLFAQKGFDETTVDDIAEAAGTSRRSFFRYFESKSDLITHGMVSYETSLIDAIQSCAPDSSLAEVMEHTVIEVARRAAALPRTRKIMEIAAKYPAARQALSRVAEVQEPVAAAFARRMRQNSEDRLKANLLAGLTLSILSATFQSWFENGDSDITITAEQAFETLGRVVCESRTRRNGSELRRGSSVRKGNETANSLLGKKR